MPRPTRAIASARSSAAWPGAPVWAAPWRWPGTGFPIRRLVPVAVALDGAPGWEDKLARFVERWVGRSEDLLKSRAAALNGALLIVVTLAMAAGIDAMFSVLQQAGRS